MTSSSASRVHPFLLAAVALLGLASLARLGLSNTGGRGKTKALAPYVQGELLVKFKGQAASHADQHIIRLLEERYGVMARPGARVRTWKLPPGLDVETALELLSYPPYTDILEYAEPNYIVQATVIPNDFNNYNLYGMSRISAPAAWDRQAGSRGVTVAVIDTGIDRDHPDLVANKFINPGEIPGNGKDDDNNGFVDDVSGWDFRNKDNNPFDGHSHGTHVAGTIGAEGNNGRGVVGVNWKVSLMACKFLSDGGSGFTSDAVNALNYIAWFNKNSSSKIRVSNNSWGGGGFSSALKSAIEGSGTIFCAAAGNSASSGLHYPSSYDSANILAVAATDSSDRLAWFSNWHPSRVDLGAPGVGIWSTTPGNKYGSKSGTSMATPHVAGACALVMAQDGSLSNSQVQARILDNVDPLSSLSGRVATGGRLNVDKALPGGAVNKPPVVSAGPDQTVQLPSTGPVTVTLNGTVSDDGLPNNTLAKLWTVLTSPPGSTVTFADDKAVSTTVELSAAGSYELQLEADDSALQTADTLIVTVQSPSVNNAPTANAGPDQTLQLPATGPITTTLQGSASDDGKPKNQLITTWRQSSGPNTMTFGNKSDPKSTVTFMDPGTYVLELEADDTALKATDQVQVTVKPRPGGQVQVLAADDFESGGFKGGSGWNGSWSVSGEAKLDKKKGHKSKYAAKLKRSSALMQRQTDLGGVTQATLGFWARAKKFRSSDEFLVQVSTDGSTFTTVKTLTRSDSDDKYHFYEVPLSSVSSTFHLRFDAEMARKGGEVYVDDIVIKGIR